METNSTSRRRALSVLIACIAIVLSMLSDGQWTDLLSANGTGTIGPLPSKSTPEPPVTFEFRPGTSTQGATNSGTFRVSAPANLYSRPLSIEIKPRSERTGVSTRVIAEWELNAYDEARENERVHQFDSELEISFTYDDDDVRALNLGTLRIFYLDEEANEWVPLPSEHDWGSRTVTAKTSHFSVFGAQAEPAYSIPGEVLNFQTNLNSGSASYTFPIELPPIPGGRLPGVQLAYSSASVDEMKNKRDVASWVGMGWSFTPGAIFINEETNERTLQLPDGTSAKIIYVSGVGWATEPDMGIKVENWWDTHPYMLITDRDGTIYKYGGSSSRAQYRATNSTSIFYYRLDLNWVCDVDSNCLMVNWTQFKKTPDLGNPDGTVRAAYPTSMHYKIGGVSGAEQFTVEFSTVDVRDDIPVTEQWGSVISPQVTEPARLTEVRVKVGDELTRKYGLYHSSTSQQWCTDYGGISYAGDMWLNRIDEYGSSGSSLIRRTKFSYEAFPVFYYDPAEPNGTGSCGGNPGNPAEIQRRRLTNVTVSFGTSGDGASVSYAYAETPSPRQNTMWTRQVVTSETVKSDTTDTITSQVVTTAFEYEGDPQYFVENNDYFGAEYRGFAKATATRADGSYTDHHFYASGSTQWYHPALQTQVTRDGDKLKGRSYLVEHFDASNNRLLAEYSDWDFVSDGDFYLLLLKSSGVQLGANGQTSWSYFSHDGYGNVIEEEHVGTSGTTDDDWKIYRDFVPNTSTWIISKPSAERIYIGLSDDDSGSDLLSDRRFYYDNLTFGSPPTKGRLTEARDFVSSGANDFIDTRYSYDIRGRVSSEWNPNDARTNYSYHSIYGSYVTQTTFPIVAAGTFSEQVGWDFRLGMPTTITDANGIAATYEYDIFGRLTAVIRDGDTSLYPTVQYEYLDWGTPGSQRVRIESKVESPDEYTWSEEYFDGLGRIVQMRAPADDGYFVLSSTVEYDTVGRVTKEYVPWLVADTTPTGYQDPPIGTPFTSYTYDALDRVLTVTGPDGAVTTHQYTPLTDAGKMWRQTTWDAAGKKTDRDFDAQGRVVQVREYDGLNVYRVTRFTYDTLGNLVEVEIDPVIDSQLPTITYSMEYDWLGRKTSMSDPDLGDWAYEYDNAGNLILQTDARGEILEFQYDAVNRLLKRCTPDCATGTVLAGLDYDDTTAGNYGIGRLTSVNAPEASVSDSYLYDSRGRVLSEERTIDTSQYLTGYAYDAAGRIIAVTLPNNEVVTSTFTTRGLPGTLSSTVHGGLVSSAQYNVLGLPTQTVFGNDVETHRDYWGIEHTGSPSNQSFGQLYEIHTLLPGAGSPDRLRLRYEWDDVGNLTSRTDVLAVETETFTYDFLDRLTEVSGAYSKGFAYDGHDNITEKDEKAYLYEALLPGEEYGLAPHYASDGTNNNNLGWQVAVDGDVAVIGAYPNGSGSAGFAYVFEKDQAGEWVETAKLLPFDGASYDRFGSAVAVSGDYILIGAYGHDANGSSSGAAYVFARDGQGDWVQAQKLLASDGAANHYFGSALDIDGEFAVIGADRASPSGSNSGAAYVFRNVSGTWTEFQKLTASDGHSGARFGVGIGIHGDTIVVGSWLNNEAGSAAGAAYVFEFDGIDWDEVDKLIGSNTGAGDRLGWAVDVDGDVIVLGAPRHTIGGLGWAGEVYVFRRDPILGWQEEEVLHHSDATGDDFFGTSVTVHGNTIAVGANGRKSQSVYQSGAAYVFVHSGGQWVELDKLRSESPQLSEWFGNSVAMDSSTIIVGANGRDNPPGTDQGAFYAKPYVFSTRAHAVSSVDSDTFSYDYNGNMVARPGVTLSWNAENLLEEVKDATSPFGLVESYLYDANGQRAVKTDANGVETHYVNQWYEVRRESGQPDEVTVHYWFGGQAVATDENGTLRFIHADHLGSSSVATDALGGLVADTTYFPYGEHRSSTGAFGTDRDFTGQRLDSGTGLHFYNARYYDSALGRFISPDIIIQLPYQPGTYNRYSYVLNNPLTHIDPTGNCVFGLPCPKKAEQAMEVVHTGLDVAGFIPGVGEFADLTNAAIYAAEGDFLNAAISGAGAIPGIGMAATGARLANKTAQGVAEQAAKKLPQDAAVNPLAPKALDLDRPISKSPSQNAALQAEIRKLKGQSATDFRVNQQQVNADGVRVGINRPDLQYTDANNVRHYIEFERPPSSRGAEHRRRIEVNDGSGIVEIRYVP